MEEPAAIEERSSTEASVQPPGLPMYQCKRCGYKWPPRVSNPKVCPSCKRRDWNEPEKEEGKT